MKIKINGVEYILQAQVAQLPGALTGLTGSFVTITSMFGDSLSATGTTLSWDSSTAAYEYLICRADGPTGVLNQVGQTLVPTTTYYDVVPPNVNLRYVVKASNICGETKSSEFALFCETPGENPRITGISVNLSENKLSWALVSDVDTFVISKRLGLTGASPGPTGPLLIVGSTGGTFFNDVGLTGCKPYYYGVQGVNVCGTGAISDPLVLVEFKLDTPVLKAFNQNGNFYWDAVLGADKYFICKNGASGIDVSTVLEWHDDTVLQDQDSYVLKVFNSECGLSSDSKNILLDATKAFGCFDPRATEVLVYTSIELKDTIIDYTVFNQTEIVNIITQDDLSLDVISQIGGNCILTNNNTLTIGSTTLVNFGIICNLSGGTIEHALPVENRGTIENLGNLNTIGIMQNYGTIENLSKLNNTGSIENFGIINNSTTGFIDNIGVITNIGAINNFNVIDNQDTIRNLNVINNNHNGNLNNLNNPSKSVVIENFFDGLINNLGRFLILDSFVQNNGTIVNSVSGTIDSIGVIVNTKTIVADGIELGPYPSGFGTIVSSWGP